MAEILERLLAVEQAARDVMTDELVESFQELKGMPGTAAWPAKRALGDALIELDKARGA